MYTVYASNIVGHTLSGKAVQRAVRGHLLVENSLNAVVTAEAFNVSLPKARDSQRTNSNTSSTNSAEIQNNVPNVLQKAVQTNEKFLIGDHLFIQLA